SRFRAGRSVHKPRSHFRWASAIDLAEHDVERADDRHHIGKHVPAAHRVDRLEKGEARRADFATIGAIAAVGDEIDAELALGRFDGGVGLAGGHVIALGVELEEVDKRLHRALHLDARRRRDFVVVDHHRARGHFLEALTDDAQALAHLLHAYEVARPAIAVPADRHVEL